MITMIITAQGEKFLIPPYLSARYYEFDRTFTVLFPEWDNVRLTAVNELLAILCEEFRSVIM